MKRIYCNKCGKKFDEFDMQADFNIRTYIGYGSEFDGDDLDIDLCCDCMDELIRSCKISPLRSDTDKEVL